MVTMFSAPYGEKNLNSLSVNELTMFSLSASRDVKNIMLQKCFTSPHRIALVRNVRPVYERCREL